MQRQTNSKGGRKPNRIWQFKIMLNTNNYPSLQKVRPKALHMHHSERILSKPKNFLLNL